MLILVSVTKIFNFYVHSFANFYLCCEILFELLQSYTRDPNLPDIITTLEMIAKLGRYVFAPLITTEGFE